MKIEEMPAGREMDINYFSAKTISHVWDFFNGLDFETKTRILILGIMFLISGNFRKGDRDLFVNILFKDELVKNKEG